MTADREAFIAELERQHRDIEDHGDGTVTMIAGCTPRSSSFVLNVDDLIASVVPPIPAPAQEPVAVPAGIDPERACRAAEAANHRFGQWMPQRWLDLFIRAYNDGSAK